jgi:hypothetical protein
MAPILATASSISKFLDIVIGYRDEWFPKEHTWGPWFRGHRCSDWPLKPSFYRHAAPLRPRTRGERDLDDELQQEFIMRAPSLTDVRPQNPWEWYFMMQHSGAPTRLLDWTEGGLIGLYFAVRDNDGSHDAAVWLLEPWWLNKRVVGHSEVIPPGARVGMAEEDSQRYDPWLPRRFAIKPKLPKMPVAVYASHLVSRISTQRSCFTVHGRQVDALEDLAQEPDAGLVKIVIPGDCTQRIKQQLLICGIDEITIYPDLDGLGRFLTTVLKTESSNESSSADVRKGSRAR